MAGKTEKININEIVNDFIQKNRKVMIICLSGIITVVIVLVAVFMIRDHLQSQALSKVAELNRRYEAIKPNINLESADLNTFLEELNQFATKNSGYAAARAYAISAGIYEELKNWTEAEKAWLGAAKAGAKTYFAPVAFFNAAVAAEEQGNFNRAIELLNESLGYEKVFPAAPRAQFSIARLQETQGDRAAALMSYMALVSKWPQDQIWVNLAHSRILSLTMER